MRLTPIRIAAVQFAFAAALAVGPAFAETSTDLGIDLKDLEGGSAPAAQPSPAPPAASPAPVAVPLAPLVKPLILVQPPNPMPLQWVPNGAPKDSELMESLPTGPSFAVTGIAAQADQYVAIVEYRGVNYVVQPGTMVPDQDDPAFQVRAITPTRVEAFDPVARRLVRRSLGAPGMR